MKILETLRAQRAALVTSLESLVGGPATEERTTLNADEQTRYDGMIAEVRTLDARIEELGKIEERGAAAATAASQAGTAPDVRVKSEPATYTREGRNSYFGDLIAATTKNDPDSRERLARHGQEVMEKRDLSRTDGAGGYFVPPLWLVDDFLAKERAGRVTADLCNREALPPGTDSINLPKITTGTAVGVQTADNGAVTEQDIVDNVVSIPVKTLAGQEDVAIQLLEQSPLAFDRVVMQDLMADYNQKLDLQVLNGSGVSGQVTGILGTSGIGSTSYSDASPTVPEAYPKLASAVNDVAGARYLPPEAWVMHPRRWYWMLAALDSANRPFVVASPAYGPQNTLGTGNGAAAQGGPAGTILGLPVYLDPNVPTTLGGGTEDAIICARFSDMWLFESGLRTRVLPEVLSGTLTVRIQLYAYVGFTAARFPTGVSKITGTGLAAPSF